MAAAAAAPATITATPAVGDRLLSQSHQLGATAGNHAGRSPSAIQRAAWRACFSIEKWEAGFLDCQPNHVAILAILMARLEQGGIARSDLGWGRSSADDELPLFFWRFSRGFSSSQQQRDELFLLQAITAIAVRKVRLTTYRVTPCASEKRTSASTGPLGWIAANILLPAANLSAGQHIHSSRLAWPGHTAPARTPRP